MMMMRGALTTWVRAGARAPGGHLVVLVTVGLLGAGCDARTSSPALVSLSGSASSPDGMVVTGAPQATAAGASVLGSGGNAADAAVAAALALAVVEPSQSGLGGRTQVVFRTGSGELGGIDATTVVPAIYDPASAPGGERGAAAVGIPGTVAGLARLHAEHGVLPWPNVVGPALALARDGFSLHPGEAARWAASAELLRGSPSVAALLLGEDGAVPGAGERIVQPRLARVFEALASDGPEVFYRGWVADSIAADLGRSGGYVTREDLSGYRALDAVMARGRIADLEVVGSWLPAGGATSIEALQILDRAGVGPTSGPGEWARGLATALTYAYQDRERVQGHPPTRAAAWITSDSLARRHGRELGSAASGPSDADEPEHTTHVAVVDADGFAVALTQSLGPSFGAAVATSSLGFLYASTLGGYLAEGGPGTRAWSSQSPLIVLRDGEPVLTLGGGGGRRIISSAVAVVARFASGESLADGLAAPRLHPTDTTVYLDDSWSDAAADGLRSAGWRVERRERSYFARLNGIARGPGGTWEGVADPVWPDGAAAGPLRPGG
ncbi:MAG: hypothetical protein HKO98_03155 [Gemmatimonadetes bacterium]|nr:hypothetical protein [Gemmatimonadota bacterium]